MHAAGGCHVKVAAASEPACAAHCRAIWAFGDLDRTSELDLDAKQDAAVQGIIKAMPHKVRQVGQRLLLPQPRRGNGPRLSA